MPNNAIETAAEIAKSKNKADTLLRWTSPATWR